MAESNSASYDTHLRRGSKLPAFKTHTKIVIQAGDNSQTLHIRETKEIVDNMWIILIAAVKSPLLCEVQMAPWSKSASLCSSAFG